MGNKISIIIPAYNEEKNIEKVILLIKNIKIVNEIIVVNNASTDKTKEICENIQNITVVDCDTQGKGYAMEEGLKVCNNEIVVYLDADILDYQENVVELLSNPIIKGEADFVKATFDRVTGGTITEVVTKPLLRVFFPEIAVYTEPLSGMIAGKKSILKNYHFEKDYGVDIGILIDMWKGNYRISEVNIGAIKNLSHESKTIQSMSKMSTEVINAIISKANAKK